MKRLFAILALFGAVSLTGLPAHAQDKPADKPAATAPAPAAPAAPAAAPAEAKPPAAAEAKPAEAKPAEAKPAPTPNKGDVAWMLVSTALVLMMRYRPEGLVPSAAVKAELRHGSARGDSMGTPAAG